MYIIYRTELQADRAATSDFSHELFIETNISICLYHCRYCTYFFPLAFMLFYIFLVVNNHTGYKTVIKEIAYF